ncbi:rhomboid family intramembrane serine protease [Gammaproteobacteria bacterium]|nr:rhomboid family intramembrane serine protease [Gammaproteobacteria bacterium]
MIIALEIPSDINLAAFSRLLSSRGVKHRITEQGPNQVVWVLDEQELGFVQSAYSLYTSGELELDEAPILQTQTQVVPRLFSAVRRFPLTFSLIVMTALLFPVGMGLGQGAIDGLFERLMFLALEEVNGQQYFTTMSYTVEQGQWWRFVTPMFIHFSWLHIVFNLLWVWEFGRRIEFTNGALVLLFVVMASSLAANVTQYLLSGPGLFGGMSGVVFGFLGHSLIWSRLVPSKGMAVPNGIYIFMLAYLVIGFTGVIDLLGLGSLANGAHLGGFIGGIVTGGLAGLLARWGQARSS